MVATCRRIIKYNQFLEDPGSACFQDVVNIIVKLYLSLSSTSRLLLSICHCLFPTRRGKKDMVAYCFVLIPPTWSPGWLFLIPVRLLILLVLSCRTMNDRLTASLTARSSIVFEAGWWDVDCLKRRRVGRRSIDRLSTSLYIRRCWTHDYTVNGQPRWWSFSTLFDMVCRFCSVRADVVLLTRKLNNYLRWPGGTKYTWMKKKRCGGNSSSQVTQTVLDCEER